MDRWELGVDAVQLGVTAVGGMLDEVVFETSAGAKRPMHTAPWVDEPRAADVPPMLHTLRGDFFCAPFGDNDLLPEETRPHGATANAHWELVDQTDQTLTLALPGPVLGAAVGKRIYLRPGQPVVYQEHTFSGGEGALPLGHHAMLRLDEPAYVGGAPFELGFTPPETFEGDPERGRSRLAYPQTFSSLAEVACADGGSADLSRYPTAAGYEDLVLLAGDLGQPLGWSAVTAPRAGWVWFGLKDTRVLRSTILWMSNGGRYYPPFSRRHTGVLGVEEVTACFHLGHRASTAENILNQRGIPTVVTLTPDAPLVVRYAFGVVAAPPEFTRVVSIERVAGGVRLVDEGGRAVEAAVDVDEVLAPGAG